MDEYEKNKLISTASQAAVKAFINVFKNHVKDKISKNKFERIKKFIGGVI